MKKMRMKGIEIRYKGKGNGVSDQTLSVNIDC